MKMQQVNFQSIEEFLAFLPENELKIVEQLRYLVFETLLDVKEKLSYNVPYYSLNRNVCFIWPASVKWGQKISYEGVRFGFTQGNQLADELNFLEKGYRKQVYWRDFKEIKVKDLELLQQYLYQAVLVDEQFRKSKTS